MIPLGMGMTKEGCWHTLRKFSSFLRKGVQGDKKVIKEDNLGDTNNLYLMLYEENSLCLVNCKMGGRQEAFIG